MEHDELKKEFYERLGKVLGMPPEVVEATIKTIVLETSWGLQIFSKEER